MSEMGWVGGWVGGPVWKIRGLDAQKTSNAPPARVGLGAFLRTWYKYMYASLRFEVVKPTAVHKLDNRGRVGVGEKTL
jgi:hypothetical protein